MADYYSILTKTISGLSTNSVERRLAVYAKARKAIEAQLRQLDPAPGEEAIRAQLNLLEETIVHIESEYKAAGSSAAPGGVEEAAPVDPDPVLPTAVPTVSEAPPIMESSVQPEIEDASESFEVESTSPSPVETYQQPADDLQYEVAPDLDPEGVPEELVEKAGSDNRTGLVPAIATLVVLALVAVGAYAIWLNRDTISNTVASVFSSDSPSPGQADGSAEAPTEAAAEQEESIPIPDDSTTDDKETVRLGEETEPQPAETAEPEPQPEEVAEIESSPTEEQTEEPAETEQSETPTEPVEAEQTETANEQAPPTDASSLGEIAYLYEEGSAGAGATRSNARVNWSVANVKPSEALPAEPVITGNMEVPEKGIAVEINIKRNVDESLSASHIIEMTFQIPEGFAGGDIENIARFVMKPSEEARGEPLVAVPVKVSDGFFLIALDNLEQAVQVNQQLLLNSDWIDIPISYSTGKRALLTLEKGASGKQIFSQSFADWQNR